MEYSLQWIDTAFRVKLEILHYLDERLPTSSL